MRTTESNAVKVVTEGTHRVREPEHTWELMRPKLARYDVTRVSDVTGLDTLNIPVVMAARPTSWTLCVSQGKGQSLMLAKVSAVMECIELWHAEHAVPQPTYAGVPATELELSYSLGDLGVVTGPFLNDSTPIDWVPAVGLVSGTVIPVPRAAIAFPDPTTQQWSAAFIRPNSNGLASGNVLDEAALHGLYEVVERDVLCGPTPDELTTIPAIDPESISDETCLGMVRAVHDAGGKVSVQPLPNPYDIPTFRVQAWSWDFPFPCGGYGSHSDPNVAVSRAVTEAAQGRLAAIVGSRDDLEDYYSYLERPRRKAEYLAQFPAPSTTLESTTPQLGPRYDDVGEELTWLARTVERVVGHEPLMVDLSTDSDFAVAKVIVPGATFEGNRVHSRLERPA